MDGGFLLVFLGTLVSAAAALFAVLGLAQRTRRQRLRRIENIRQRAGAERLSPGAGPGLDLRREGREPSLLDRIAVKLLPRPARFSARLARAGGRISAGAYFGASLTIAAGVTFAISGVFGFPLAIGLIGGLAMGVGVPHKFVGLLGDRRAGKFITLFPEAIDLMVRGLKSGLPISECINTVGTEIVDPVGREFREISDRMKLGQTLENALWESAGRLRTADFNFFAISLGVQRETGGNLAETLANLSSILRHRKQMKLKIKAMSSEANASAYILGSLPFLMLAILFVLNPDYISVLFTDPRGQMAVGAGLAMMGAGVFVMFKMVRFEI